MSDGIPAEEIGALLARHGSTLVALAAASIRHRLETGAKPRVEPGNFAPELSAPGACFITLTRHGALRGCIGTVEACRPLVQDVAENAIAAAFEEPRFPALGRDEMTGLGFSVSVLTVPVPVETETEQDLLSHLRPGRDGLILREGMKRSVYLPQVWDLFSSPVVFVAELKRKAGLPADHWSPSLRVLRFEAVSATSENYELR
jgi:AmmeMemoRadiSam system protein A